MTDPSHSQTTGLTDEQSLALAQAAERARSFRGVAFVARFNGISSLFLAACMLFVGFLIILFGTVSIGMFFAAAVLGVVGYIELRGASAVDQIRPERVQQLVWNQLAFLGAITLYCAMRMYQVWYEPLPESTMQELRQLDGLVELGDVEQLSRNLGMLMYVLIFVLSVVFVGGCALYYRRKVAKMRRYIADTPDWVVQIQRGGGR